MRRFVGFRSMTRIIVFFVLLTCSVGAGRAVEFRLTFPDTVSTEPLAGRVYVFLTDDTGASPHHGPSPTHQVPFYARDVVDWQPGQVLVLDDTAEWFGLAMKDLRGRYALAAVLDRDETEQSHLAPGNIYSRKLVRVFGPGVAESIDITLDRRKEPPQYEESELQKEVILSSRRLTEHLGRPVALKAAVVLPESYHRRPDARYPVVYAIPGFGGRHYHIFMGPWNQKRYGMRDHGLEKIFVFLDGDCPTGHPCYVDSVVNGPWATALVEELVPHIDATFRTLAAGPARLLTGQSSGAWAALWLQLNYPDTFGGAWAGSPDPVDFRSFVGVNLYEAGVNMFTDAEGHERPLGKAGGETLFTYREISDMEDRTGNNGFLATFEAQFSPAGENGEPRRLWDRRTGTVDPAVVAHWRQFDISLRLRENWPALKDKLSGKLFIYVSAAEEADLCSPVRRLDEEMKKLDADVFVRVLDKGNHGDDVWRQIIDQVHEQMDRRLLAAYPQLEPPAPASATAAAQQN